VKLRIRAETHRLYSERRDGLREAILAHLALQPGLLILDVGCGPGSYHASLQRGGAVVMAVDASPGMVREARARDASSTYHRVQLAQADAQALPFLGETFDRVLAAHMLFHVPDREAALRDMRRVLRPGGRVVLATNGTPYLAGLERLHQQAAAALGYVPTAGDGVRFTLDDVALVRSVFPSAGRHVLDNALVLHRPEPALDYYASGVIDRIADRPADGSHRARLLPLVRAGIEAILERDGVLRDSKPAGCFVADVP